MFSWLWRREELASFATEDSPIKLADPFADVIALGAPFTDPIADGPTIQTSHTVRSQRIRLDEDIR